MSEREPTGRHRLAENLADLGDDSPEPGPLPRRVRKNDVTISLPVKALSALVLGLFGGGGVYAGHRAGSQSADAAVAELHAMDVRVRKIEDGRLEDIGNRKQRDQELNDKLETINGKVDSIKTSVDQLTRTDRRNR